MRLRRRHALCALFTATAVTIGSPNILQATTVTSTWTGSTSVKWSVAGNWSPNSAAPNNGNNGVSDYNVIIGVPSPTQLDISQSIDSLTINAGGTLQTNGGTTLTLNSPILLDNGGITVDNHLGNATGITTVQFTSNTSLMGNGTLTLNGNTGSFQALLKCPSNVTLTQAAGHTINGNGQISGAFVNNGVVNGNFSSTSLQLFTGPVINNNLMESTAGNLVFNAITVTQGSSGVISAINTTNTLSGAAELFGTTVSGGTLSSSGVSGLCAIQNNATISNATITTSAGAQGMQLSGSTFSNCTFNSSGTGVVLFENNGSTLNNSTSTAQVDVKEVTLIVNGNLTDSGTITVDGIFFGGANLSFNGGSLLGNGTVAMLDNGTLSSALLSGSLMQGANHTISGHGEITAALTNNGTVNANVSGTTLLLQSGTMTNNNLFEASSNGTLTISGATLVQGPAGIISANNSTVNVANETVSGGTLACAGVGATFNLDDTTVIECTLNSSTGGMIQIADSVILTNVVNNSLITVPGGAILNSNGNMTNNGTIMINGSPGTAVASMTVNGGTLSGTGTIILNDNSNPFFAQLNGSLTQGPGHTLSGHGTVNASVVNNGVIIANINATTLILNSSITNNGLAQASNGGTLRFGAGALSNFSNGTLSGGTYEVDANSTMVLPGNISTNAASIVLSGTNISFAALLPLTTNNGSLMLKNGASLLVSSALTNTGIVSIANNPLSILTVGGSYTQTANATLTGGGTLIAAALFGNLSTINGLVRVASNGTNAATSNLTALTLAGTAGAWTGNLDITNNKVILEATPATKTAVLSTVQNQALFGRTHVAGITSSTLPANLVIAVVDNAALASAFITFGGQPVDANSILIAPELLGDANIDGHVDLNDLNTVLNNLGTTTSLWTSGNFDGQSTIDLNDLNAVLNNLGTSFANNSEVVAAQALLQNSAMATPEPASLGMLAMAPFFCIARRNKRMTSKPSKLDM